MADIARPSSTTRRAALLGEAGASFRALRKRLGWTQKALAERARVSRDTIHRLERGEVVDLSSPLALLDAMGQRLAFEPKQTLRAEDMRAILIPSDFDTDSKERRWNAKFVGSARKE
ncbi:MAG TPA: helix-turn-helix domain-containing protein [Burkholderiaceae bacterium]|nr:helix-turn-helix domain-containing protein [Burkholderiaceae bacterium]